MHTNKLKIQLILEEKITKKCGGMNRPGIGFSLKRRLRPSLNRKSSDLTLLEVTCVLMVLLPGIPKTGQIEEERKSRPRAQSISFGSNAKTMMSGQYFIVTYINEIETSVCNL